MIEESAGIAAALDSESIAHPRCTDRSIAVHKLFSEIINPAGGTDVMQKGQSPIAL